MQLICGRSRSIVIFGKCAFQQRVGIPMGTNGAPLLANLFRHSYEADLSRTRKGSNPGP